MALTEESIAELKTAYLAAYGKHLADDEAWELGHRLLQIYDLATRPLPEEHSQATNPDGQDKEVKGADCVTHNISS